MKLAIKTVLSCAAILAAALPASAALQLRLSDGMGAVVTVADGDPLDANPSPGVVSYSGPVGLNWQTTISTGGSKPVLGTASAPHLDLNTFEINSVSAGTLTVELTDTGFTGIGGAALISVGGTTAGQVTYKTFSDNSNAGFGKATPISSFGPLTGQFAQNGAAAVTAMSPYSLTLEVTVDHTALGLTGLDAELQIGFSNCVQKAEPLAPCSDSTNHHALFMRGIGIDFVFNPTPGTFVEFPGGTATISGNLVSVVDPTKTFALDLQLSGRTDVAPPGSPRKQMLPCAYKPLGPIDTDTFYYYPNFTGTLVGGGSLAGAKLTIGPVMGLAFQVGVGASGKNYNFGASSWFLWTVNMQPIAGSPLPVTGQGDFNLDIFDCANPPPAPPIVVGGGALAAPINVSDTPSSSKVKLSWSSSSGAASYTILRSATKGGPYVEIKKGATSTSYTDSTVVNGTPYYYAVCAVKNSTMSPPSAEVSSIPSAGVSSPWSTKDIGAVGDAGAASRASSTYTVVGSGSDISGTSDEFRYAYQSANNNCTIIARVVDVQNTDPFAKGGVMIRESLNANSKHASVMLTADGGVTFANRASSGGATTTTIAPVLSAQWVKVVRSGNTFSGYSSPDGSTWTLVGSKTISMGSSIYIGLAANSRNDGTLCTVHLDNITAKP